MIWNNKKYTSYFITVRNICNVSKFHCARYKYGFYRNFKCGALRNNYGALLICNGHRECFNFIIFQNDRVHIKQTDFLWICMKKHYKDINAKYTDLSAILKSWFFSDTVHTNQVCEISIVKLPPSYYNESEPNKWLLTETFYAIFDYLLEGPSSKYFGKNKIRSKCEHSGRLKFNLFFSLHRK